MFKKKNFNIQVNFDGGDALIWKHPMTKIDTETKVMVPYTHEVIFIKEGVMLNSLVPGVHQPAALPSTMSRREKKQAQKLFECSILYVNVQSTMQVLWGTPSRIDVFDTKIKMPVSVGLSGSMVVRINDPRVFISRFGGLDALFTKDQLHKFFQSIMVQYIKEALSNVMTTEGVSFYEIWNNTRKITDGLKAELLSKFNDYGVELREFSIDNIVIPDDVKKIVENVYKEKFVIESKGLSHKELYEDIKDDRKETRETIKEVATTILKNSKPTKQFCPECGHEVQVGSKFCSNCGRKF